MAASMLVTGKEIKPTVRVDSFMLMVMFMKESGLMTKLMEEVSMNILMGLNM